MEQETCRESIQMRHAETLALNKLKAYDTEKTQSKVQGNALLNYTYGWGKKIKLTIDWGKTPKQTNNIKSNKSLILRRNRQVEKKFKILSC